MEKDSTSTWTWSRVRGLRGVREVRDSSKQKHAVVKVTEDEFRLMGWSLPNGPKMLCGPSLRNTVPKSLRSNMVKWTLLTGTLSPDTLTLVVFMHESLPLLRLRLIESFRRLLVRCKNSFYWDLELSHSMKSESHHPFAPIHFSLVLRKDVFLSLVPFTTVSCISPPQKKMRLLMILTTPVESLSLRFPKRETLKILIRFTQTETQL
jgi:hypothetical protein